VSCGQAHSSARELVAQGQEVKLVAETVGISRSSLYYRRKPHAARADRRLDAVIVEACGAKPAYGYRRVAWWLDRKQGVVISPTIWRRTALIEFSRNNIRRSDSEEVAQVYEPLRVLALSK
jgi:hypothetical protein